MPSALKYVIISILIFLISVQFLVLPWKYHVLSYVEKQLAIAIGLGIISLLLAVKKKLYLPKTSFTWIFLAFIFWILVSSFWAVNSSLIWPVFIVWIIFFMAYLVAVSLPMEILNASILTTFILVIITLNVMEVYFVLIRATVRNDWSLSLVLIENTVKTFNLNTNYIGSLFLLYVPVLRAIPYKAWQQAMSRTTIFLIVCLIPLLNSRAVSLALIFLVIFYGLHGFKEGYLKKYLAFLFLSLGLSFFIYQSLIANKKNFKDKYNPIRSYKLNTGDDRLKLWSNTLLLVKEKPILGSGAGNWFVEIKKYGLNEYSGGSSYAQAHNVWLETAAELGLIGLLLLIGIGISCFAIILRIMNWHLIAFFLSISILLSFYGLYKPRGNYLSSYYLISFIWIGLQLRKINTFRISHLCGFIYCLLVTFSIYLIFNFVRFSQYTDRLNKAEKQTLADEILNWDNYYMPWLTTLYRGKPALDLKSNCLWKIGLREQAINVQKAAHRIDPYNQSSWFKLGRRYQLNKDFENAGNAYLEVLNLYEDDADASLALTNLGIKTGNDLLYNQGVKLYYERIAPDFSINYSDHHLTSENLRISKFWKKRCRDIDTYQKYIEQWETKSLR